MTEGPPETYPATFLDSKHHWISCCPQGGRRWVAAILLAVTLPVTPAAHASDPTPAPHTGVTPSGPGADAKMRNQEPLPRNLRYAMAALAGLGVMASFGAASVSLRPREETHDRFIE